MKIIPLATNHICIQLDSGCYLDINEATTINLNSITVAVIDKRYTIETSMSAIAPKSITLRFNKHEDRGSNEE